MTVTLKTEFKPLPYRSFPPIAADASPERGARMPCLLRSQPSPLITAWPAVRVPCGGSGVVISRDGRADLPGVVARISAGHEKAASQSVCKTARCSGPESGISVFTVQQMGEVFVA